MVKNKKYNLITIDNYRFSLPLKTDVEKAIKLLEDKGHIVEHLGIYEVDEIYFKIISDPKFYQHPSFYAEHVGNVRDARCIMRSSRALKNFILNRLPGQKSL